MRGPEGAPVQQCTGATRRMASAAPGVSVGLTLAALAVAAAYAGGPVIVLTAIPDADHRQRVPPAEYVVRELRSVVRMGRPVDQPVSGMADRMGDDRRLRYRRGVRCRGHRPERAGCIHRPPAGRAVAGHRHRHRDHAGHAGGRDRRHPADRPHAGRDGRRRIRHPDRIRDHRPGTGIAARARHVPGHRRLVQPARNRRPWQPSGRAADCRVYLFWLGWHRLRERGSQAPPAESGAGGHPRRSDSYRIVRAGDHRPARCRVTSAGCGRTRLPR